MSYSINEAELLIDKLLVFYDVKTYSDLALALNVSQANISSWKIRNSINAIKRKCKEIGIFNEIFKDFKEEIFNDLEFSDFDKIKTLKQQCKKYNIKTTTIENEKILYFFETLFRDCEMNNKLEELEKDIKNLILKYNPKIDKATQDLFFEFLEKNSKKENS